MLTFRRSFSPAKTWHATDWGAFVVLTFDSSMPKLVHRRLGYLATESQPNPNHEEFDSGSSAPLHPSDHGLCPVYVDCGCGPAVTAGLTTYRFYVDMQDATDRMSAVFGNDQASLLVNAPGGAFNSAFNSSWNASGINPAFLPVFPDLADDTYATIGLMGPASTSGIAGAADPSIVEDSNQPITPFFLTPGATNLESTTLTGASWYVLNTAANGLPDANFRC